MSAAAKSFLDRLEQLGLVDDAVLDDLRRMVADGRSDVKPDTLAKMLVEDGQLTPNQAKKLLSSLPAAPDEKKPGGGKPAPPKPKAPPANKGGDDLLSLADDDSMAIDADPGDNGPANLTTTIASKETFEAEEIIVLEEAPSAAKPKPAAAPPASTAKPSKPAKPAKPAPPAAKAPTAAPSGLTPVAAPALTPIADAGLTPIVGDANAGGLTPMGPAAGGMAGLGGGVADPFSNPMAGGGIPPGPVGGAPAGFQKVKPKTFDSPFMLLGSGGLVLLIAAFVILAIIFMRGNASEMFEAAESDYKAQSYAQAIAKYDKFLAQFANDPNSSKARVRRGLAEIRSMIEGGSKDYKNGLQRAQEVIPKIENEEKFQDGRQELAGILPEIASGLAKQARQAGATKNARELVELTDKALELVNNPNHIPTSMRASQQNRIDDIIRTLAEARRHIEQEDALTKAIGDIETAAGAGQTGQAFEIRKGLLHTFPALEQNEQLAAVVQKVAQRERELVQSLSSAVDGVAQDEAAVPGVRQVLITHRRGGAVEKPEQPTLFFLAAGSVYGVEAATGKILWRRYVGYETRVHPIAIGKAPNVDALVADGARQELLRLEGLTGKLVWRLPVGERFSPPALVGTRALVTTETGAIWDVDLESGKSGRRVKFPQQLNVEAGPIGTTGVTYQVGSHSHVYALSLEKLTCDEVFYLGHRAGTIAVPPVMALNHLVVAENAGPDYCLLHVLATNAEGLSLQRPAEQEPIRVSGHVTSPLIQIKNRVIAVSNLGEIRVIDIDQTNAKKPAKVSATLVKSLNRPQSSFGLVDGAQIWLASDRFVSFDIQASRQQLNRRWVKHEQEAFVTPLQRSGKTVFHARRRRGSPGVTVAAVNLDDGQPIWQTDLAVPLPLVIGDSQRQQIVAINGQGDLYRLDKDAIDAGLRDKPTESAEVEGSETTYTFSDPQPVSNGRYAFFSDLDRPAALVFDPSRPNDELGVIRVDTAGAAVTCQPTLFGGSMLLPLDNGQVWLADLSNGKQRLLPFQSKVEPGLKVRWLRPSVLAGDSPECVLADSRQKLYRLGIKDQPSPHLSGLAEVDLPEPPLTPPAVSVDTVFAVSRGADADKLHLLPLPGLTEGKEVPLGGRLVQGPWQVGASVLLVTDSEGLLCFGSEPTPRWKMPLPSGPLAAPPRLDGDSILLSSLRGEVWRASLEDGKVIKKLDLRMPLLGSPVPDGERVLVGGADGTLYILPPL